MRLSKAAKEFNVGISTIVEFLEGKGIKLDANPNAKIDDETYHILEQEYSKDKKTKERSEEKSKIIHSGQKLETIEIDENITPTHTPKDEEPDNIILITDTNADIVDESTTVVPEKEKPKLSKPKILGKIDLDKKKTKKEEIQEKPKVTEEKIKPETTKIKIEPKEEKKLKVLGKIELPEEKKKIKQKQIPKKEEPKPIVEEKPVLTEKKEDLVSTEKEENPPRKKEEEVIHAKAEKLTGPKVLGSIELPEKKKKESKPKEKSKNKLVASSKEEFGRKKKKKRERIKKGDKGAKSSRRKEPRKEISEEDVQKQIKETLARLTNKQKNKGVKHRKDKREAVREKIQQQERLEEKEKTVLKVAEFVSVNEIATMMNVPVVDVISTCMSVGLYVAINQRLDADAISLVAEEFGFTVNFVSAETEDEVVIEEEDNEEDLLPRPPIVTVMGHVDHGKTKLLDYIRDANVVAGEAGGITQHIGAYSVDVNGKEITFLDTPGHEAFTAMRARGAQVTDIAIIVVAADDGLMPQSIEAINHAQAAGVPMIFAINKIDKPSANPEKVKEQLSQMNILLEDWGGKFQSQEISAKQGTNIDLLLEKVLLEAELLDLKANPNAKASGVVIESTLEKGRGYVSTILVQRGTLKMKDIVVAGSYFGHAKAMFNERNKKIEEAGPSKPLILLGLNGAPQAGDKFKVVESAAEAKEITIKRQQLIREQSFRTKKHITLDEIGRRLKIGNFKELNFVVKGDVDGSIEAMSDAIIKLSNDEIQVNVIHKAVGQISESDVMLAAASDAVILGFQVRPSLAARQLAEKEEVEIRLYSIIYDAINEIKDAMEGMLSPEIKETIQGSAEVKEVFKVSKVGKIAGCQVLEGKILRDSHVRIIRDGIVIYTGVLESLKRYKDDVNEVKSGMECGLNVENFKDIKVGDVIEAFMETEVRRKL